MDIDKDFPDLAGLSQDLQEEALKEAGLYEQEQQEKNQVQENQSEQSEKGEKIKNDDKLQTNFENPDQSQPGGQKPSYEERLVPLKALQEERAKKQALQAELEMLRIQAQQAASHQSNTASHSSIKEQVFNIGLQKYKDVYGKDFDLEFSSPVEVAKLTSITQNIYRDIEVCKQKYAQKQYEQQQAYLEQVSNQQQIVNDYLSWSDILMTDAKWNTNKVLFEQGVNNLPVQEKMAIIDAVTRLESGRGTKADLLLAKREWNNIVSKGQENSYEKQLKNNFLKTASNFPRSANLSNGGSSTDNLSFEQISQMIDEGRDIPANVLNMIKGAPVASRE